MIFHDFLTPLAMDFVLNEGIRTFSNNKWTENELLMTVDHFGSGGRRSDSRLGRRGEKFGDCGIVGLWDCGEIAISEISGFFMFFLI